MVISECSRVLWFGRARMGLWERLVAAVPTDVRWKSIFQQVALLAASLDPASVSAEQVDRQPVAADGYEVSRCATGIWDTRALWPPMYV